MKLYNTLTEKKEALPVPLDLVAGGDRARGKPLRMFVCGPTVYDAPHIGNMRTYAAFDIFARYLKFQKIKFFYLQNVTDVDDKIIRRAREEKISPFDLAKKVEKLYHEAEKSLGIKSVTKYARASEYIPQIITQIKTLIEKGFAYKIEGDPPTGQAGGYYFDISKFSDYGKLAKRTVSDAEDGVSRIDESIAKRNKGDFALWKLHHGTPSINSGNKEGLIKNPMIIDGEPLWHTEFGLGRPGWHIEDTAITEKFFGPQYDLHGGAVDLKFPHHEAEIAQQEAASGKKPLVKLWMHTGFLLADGKKMSKSLGNFITISAFLQKYSAEVFRHIVASHHYRSPLNYTDDLAEQSKNALSGLQEFAAKLDLISKKGGAVSKVVPCLPADRLRQAREIMRQNFIKAMDDDLNTPGALAVIFVFINANQKDIWNAPKSEAKEIKKILAELLDVLGISFEAEGLPSAMKKLLSEREKKRANKDFAGADHLRTEIERAGYKVEDTSLGPLVIRM